MGRKRGTEPCALTYPSRRRSWSFSVVLCALCVLCGSPAVAVAVAVPQGPCLILRGFRRPAGYQGKRRERTFFRMAPS